MRMSGTRRPVSVALAAMGVVLAVASVASACTVAEGRMVVTTPNGGRSEAVASVSAAHAYCAVSGDAAAASGDQIELRLSSVGVDEWQYDYTRDGTLDVPFTSSEDTLGTGGSPYRPHGDQPNTQPSGPADATDDAAVTDCTASSFSPSNDPDGGAGWYPCDPAVTEPRKETCDQGLYQYKAGIGTYEVRFQPSLPGATPFNRKPPSDRTGYGNGTVYSHRLRSDKDPQGGLVVGTPIGDVPVIPPATSPGNTACIDDPIGTPNPDYTVLGTMKVRANGLGTWRGTIPAGVSPSAPSDAAAICVRAERAAVATPAPPSDYTGATPYYRPDSAKHSLRTNMVPLVLL